MPKPHHLRGAGRLAVEATAGVTRVVEAMHAEIARLPLTPARTRSGGITGLVYGSVRGVTRLVGGGLDLALAALTPLLEPADAADAEPASATLAALNGVLGDYLEDSGNPLAIAMGLHPLVAGAQGQTLVLLHGLGMNEAQWRREGADFPAALAARGYRPLGLRYNSGRAIGRNGAELARLLETLAEAGPLTLIGHSMGGLVARSAIVQAQAQGLAWPQRLRALISLGSPHLGAPLERGGQQLQLLLGLSAYSRPLALLAGRRSAGIRDLRHGSLLEDDAGRASVIPLPTGPACYAVAGSLAKKPLAGRWPGDGLVSVASALGRHRTRGLAFRDSALFAGIGHLALQTDARVLARLSDWLGPVGAAAGATA